jgi:BirA family transcriptional regulator, biotin operon repressor / biotin---[acetyl-CoA-carboxylase] ligase
MTIGRPRLHHRRTDSTNERAKALAEAGAPQGTLVTADEQTAGRGRQGRTWTAPAGGAVLMSLVLGDLDERRALLPLAAAVAVCEACEACAPVECRVKWPNDIWIGERKVAGILLEGRPQAGWAVLGVGVNVLTRAEELPPELRESATSLAVAAPSTHPPAVESMLDALLRALEARLDDPPERTLAAWRERDALLGRRVRWDGGEGTAAGVSEAGALIVETDAGRAELDAGEVHLVL